MSRTHGQVVVISKAVAAGLHWKREKERKTCWAVYSGTCTSGQVAPQPPFSPSSTRSPHQWRHLSLNTTLMKVIHFNGASFQTLVIKACGALVWEVVETVWVPVLQINSPLWANGHLNTTNRAGQITVMERRRGGATPRRNLNHAGEMKTTFS